MRVAPHQEPALWKLDPDDHQKFEPTEKQLIPGTPFVSYFFRQLNTPKTSNYYLKNRAQKAFQLVLKGLFWGDEILPCYVEILILNHEIRIPTVDGRNPAITSG